VADGAKAKGKEAAGSGDPEPSFKPGVIPDRQVSDTMGSVSRTSHDAGTVPALQKQRERDGESQAVLPDTTSDFVRPPAAFAKGSDSDDEEEEPSHFGDEPVPLSAKAMGERRAVPVDPKAPFESVVTPDLEPYDSEEEVSRTARDAEFAAALQKRLDQERRGAALLDPTGDAFRGVASKRGDNAKPSAAAGSSSGRNTGKAAAQERIQVEPPKRIQAEPRDEMKVVASPVVPPFASSNAPMFEGKRVSQVIADWVLELTGTYIGRPDPYSILQRLLIVEATDTRDDKEFLALLRKPLSTGKSLLDVLLEAEETLEAALTPDETMDEAERENALRIKKANMPWIKSQQALLRRLKGENSMGAAVKTLHILHAAVMSSLPFLTGAIPNPKNGAYLAGATAAILRYSVQMIGLLRLETIDARTILDTLVSRQYTWAANAAFLLIPTALHAEKVLTNKGFTAAVAIADFAALVGLERRAEIWEKTWHRADGPVGDGKVALPDGRRQDAEAALQKIQAGIKALKDLREKFEGLNYRLTGGLSAQLSHLATDQVAIEAIVRASINAGIAGTSRDDADDAAGPGGNEIVPAAGQSNGIRARINKIDDMKRKLLLAAVAAMIQTFQVVTTSKNPALLPDFFAYLFVVISAMFRSIMNPENTYQDVQNTFLDYNAGSVIGIPYNIANYAKPETINGTANPESQLGIDPPDHVLGFALWTLYLSLSGLTISPFVGGWLATILDGLFGGVTKIYGEVANCFKKGQMSDADTEFPYYSEADAHADVGRAPREEVFRLGPLANLSLLGGGGDPLEPHPYRDTLFAEPSDSREGADRFVDVTDVPPSEDDLR
jgi:hypothetical protein